MTDRFDRAWLENVRQRRDAGDAWEWEVSEFLSAMRRLARGTIARTSRDALPLADDIIAEVDAKFVTRGIAQYRGNASPKSYYLAIVAKTTFSTVRCASSKEKPIDPAVAAKRVDAADQTDDDRELRIDTARAVSRALQELYRINPQHAEAFELYYQLGIGTDALCGERVGTTAEGFRKRRERALEFVIKRLKP